MNFKLRIQPEAEVEIHAAMEWYERSLNGLGAKFFFELGADLTRITKHPYHSSVFKEPYRRSAMRRFPFIIIFRVEKDTIVIDAVFHTRRRPRF